MMNPEAPLDLTSFGIALKLLGPLYWLFTVALTVTVLWLPGRIWVRLACAAVTLAGLAYPVATQVDERDRWPDPSSAGFAAAMAHFEMRCRTAGERVNRVVEEVDGIVLMRWRGPRADPDQFTLDDPYGRDCGGDDCIRILLRATGGAGLGRPQTRQYASGYRLVEALDPGDGRRYRYTAVLALARARSPGPDVYEFRLERQPIDAFTARYGLTWADISTPEDREHWVAGGVLKAIDLQTQEVVAERTGYLVNTRRGRIEHVEDPWAWARMYAPRCPKVDERTWDFASRHLPPSRADEPGRPGP